jgi:N-acetylneuraminic acid mutarotase
MKKRRGITRHHAGWILSLVGLLSAITLDLKPAMVASAQAVARSWSYTGDLNTSRYLHTATLLPDGKVLVAGGSNSVGALDSAELYDPDKGTWSNTGSLNVARSIHTATLLQDGKVLVAGGITLGASREFATNTVELYDPALGTWSLTGNLNVGRDWHTATLLQDGKVLVAGGDVENYFATEVAELYDPATGTWSITGSLNVARLYHTATLLQDGKVLLAGGCKVNDCDLPAAASELYDPNKSAWSITASLNAPHSGHTATQLPNGNVLLVGGGWGLPYLDTNELYNPATTTWSFTGRLRRHDNHTATLLANGNVLVAGGGNYGFDVPRSDNTLNNADIYNPATSDWKKAGKLNAPRFFHTATLLSSGKVLVVGGYDGRFDNTFLRSAEIYDPDAPIPPPRIISASVAGKKLIVIGENFNSDALILINGEEQKTRNDDQNPQTTLIGRKSGRKIKPGDKLQVRNPDGTVSEEFIFTGS